MEDILIPFIVFGFIALVVKWSIDYSREKQRLKHSGGGSPSMTTSELRRLVQEAVETALDTRLQRIEGMIERLEEPRQLTAGKPGEADDPGGSPVGRERDLTR